MFDLLGFDRFELIQSLFEHRMEITQWCAMDQDRKTLSSNAKTVGGSNSIWPRKYPKQNNLGDCDWQNTTKTHFSCYFKLKKNVYFIDISSFFCFCDIDSVRYPLHPRNFQPFDFNVDIPYFNQIAYNYFKVKPKVQHAKTQ